MLIIEPETNSPLLRSSLKQRRAVPEEVVSQEQMLPELNLALRRGPRVLSKPVQDHNEDLLRSFSESG